MRIPRIHHPAPLREGEALLLGESASRHLLQVLRLRPGAELRLFDGAGGEHRATLLAREGRRARVTVGSPYPDGGARESPLEIVLAQGVSRGERMDYTLQKAVELGVSRIVPLFTRRSTVRLSGERLERRRRHWQGILVHACEQCGRRHLPVLDPPQELESWANALPDAALRLLLDAEADTGLARLAPPDGTILLLAGPEGGLDPRERRLLYERGFQGLRLGPRILRTETAALAALAALQALWGDFR